MISLKLIVFLAIGTVLMWIPIVAISHWYKIKIWKTIPISILLTIAGTISTYIWYFIENLGVGRSFYGAVFLVPLFFLAVAKIMHVGYGELMDLCAPAECVMLSIMKIQCLVDGCCGGRTLFVMQDGREAIFPSQLTEMINAVLVFVFLIFLAHKEKNRGMIYPWYMIAYGGSRFVLNFFRASAENAFLGLSIGSVWSVVAFIIGVYCFYRRKKRTSERTEI